MQVYVAYSTETDLSYSWKIRLWNIIKSIIRKPESVLATDFGKSG